VSILTAYGEQADMWYFEMEKGAGAIISMEGGTQGCVGGGIIHFYGSYDFCIGLQNIVEEVYDDGDILRWHADDGLAIVGMEAAMTVLGHYLYLSTGTESGIVLNAEKTVVLLPRFRCQADRDHAIQLYLERGLLERNILVNPRDFPARSPSRSNAELK
jgi:hypothetical protein